MGRLGYGAANIGNLHRELTDDEAWAVLDAAWDSGVRAFDTAPHYGLGLSERRLGAFLRTKPRDEYVLSTKVGRLLRPNPDDDGGLDLENDFHVPAALRRVWDFSGEGIRMSLDESLERLGLDRIDLVYLHDPERQDLDLAVGQGLPALLELRESGIVSAVGVGTMTTAAIGVVTAAAALDVVMIAGRYTLLEQPAAAAFPEMSLRGTAAVAASVFNSGLLASSRPDRNARYEYGRLPEELWDRLVRIARICDGHHVPLPVAAIQFPLRAAIVRSVVVGGSRPAQVSENAARMQEEVPEALWRDLAAAGLIPR